MQIKYLYYGKKMLLDFFVRFWNQPRKQHILTGALYQYAKDGKNKSIHE